MLAATHCFDRDLMDTLVKDNIDPIARAEVQKTKKERKKERKKETNKQASQEMVACLVSIKGKERKGQEE